MIKLFSQNIRHNSYSNNYSQKQFISKINNFINYNFQYIEEFNFKIKKPEKNISECYMIYNATITLKKDTINIQKHFKNNNIEEIFDEISYFISNEIKI
jgi:hypothetical protein